MQRMRKTAQLWPAKLRDDARLIVKSLEQCRKMRSHRRSGGLSVFPMRGTLADRFDGNRQTTDLRTTQLSSARVDERSRPPQGLPAFIWHVGAERTRQYGEKSAVESNCLLAGVVPVWRASRLLTYGANHVSKLSSRPPARGAERKWGGEGNLGERRRRLGRVERASSLRPSARPSHHKSIAQSASTQRQRGHQTGPATPTLL